MKTYRESGGVTPRIPNLGTRSRWMIRIMARPP